MGKVWDQDVFSHMKRRGDLRKVKNGRRVPPIGTEGFDSAPLDLRGRKAKGPLVIPLGEGNRERGRKKEVSGTRNTNTENH